MTYDSEVLADSPVIYLKLGESSGTTAFDSSGNGNNFTYQAGVTLGQTGLVADGSTSVSQTSGNDVADLASTPTALQNPSGFTLEVWVNLPNTNMSHQCMGVAAIAYAFGVSSGSDTTWNNGGNTLVGVAGGVAWVPSGFSIGSAGTHHLAVTRDSTGWYWYVDGSLLGSHAAVTPNSGTGTCAVGGLQGGTATYHKAAFYASRLSTARIAAHYAAATGGGGGATPRGVFHLNDSLRRQAVVRASSY